MADGQALKPPRELTRYLVPNERIVVLQHKHWMALGEPILSTILGIFIVGWLDAVLSGRALVLRDVAILLWLAFVARLFWRIFDFQRDIFVATDRRLLNTYGILTRHVAMMPLSKVTDMKYDRTVPGKVLGYGLFVLESAGQDQALSTIKFVKHPDITYRQITSEIFKPPARRATDVRPPVGSGSLLPVVEPDDVWWRRT